MVNVVQNIFLVERFSKSTQVFTVCPEAIPQHLEINRGTVLHGNSELGAQV